MARTQRGDIRCEEHQRSVRQSLRRHRAAGIVNHTVAQCAFLRIQRHKTVGIPRVGVIDRHTALGRAFFRAESAVGFIGAMSQSLVEHCRGLPVCFLEICFFRFPQGLMEIRFPGILKVPCVLRSHQDIAPALVHLCAGSGGACAEHRPQGLGLNHPLLVAAVHRCVFRGAPEAVGPVFGIIAAHHGQTVAVTPLKLAHELVASAYHDFREGITVVPCFHGVRHIGVQRTVVPQCP